MNFVASMFCLSIFCCLCCCFASWSTIFQSFQDIFLGSASTKQRLKCLNMFLLILGVVNISHMNVQYWLRKNIFFTFLRDQRHFFCCIWDKFHVSIVMISPRKTTAKINTICCTLCFYLTCDFDQSCTKGLIDKILIYKKKIPKYCILI